MLKARSLQKTLETINNVNKIGSKYNIFTSLRAIDELKERITTQYDNYNSNKGMNIDAFLFYMKFIC